MKGIPKRIHYTRKDVAELCEDYERRIAKLKAKNQRYKDAMKPLEGRSPMAALKYPMAVLKYIDHLEQTIKRLREAVRIVYGERALADIDSKAALLLREGSDES